MNKQKIILLSVLVVIVLGIGIFYGYQVREANKFKKIVGYSEDEIRAQMANRRLELDIFLTPTGVDKYYDLVSELKSQPWTESVVYTSSYDALEDFKKQRANSPTFDQELKELQTNPLRATVEVKIKECSQQGLAEQFLKSPDIAPMIEYSNFSRIACDFEKSIDIIKQAF